MMELAEAPVSIVSGGSFQILYDRGVYSVTYRKMGLRRPVLYGTLLFVPCLIAMALLNVLSLFWLLLLLAPLLSVAVLLQLLPITGTFHLSRYLYSVGGRRYDRRRIPLLFLHVPYGQSIALPIAAGGDALGNRFAAAAYEPVRIMATDSKAAGPGGRLRRRLLELYGRRRCSVGFVIGGQRVPLATGLRAGVASELFQRVVELSREG